MFSFDFHKCFFTLDVDETTWPKSVKMSLVASEAIKAQLDLAYQTNYKQTRALFDY